MPQSSFIAATTASGASLQIAREEADRLLLGAGFESRDCADRWMTPDGRTLTSEQALPEAMPMLASAA
jgi:hypothetical protein